MDIQSVPKIGLSSVVHSKHIDINKIVEKVLDRLREDKKSFYEEMAIEKENTDYDNSINDLVNEMPDQLKYKKMSNSIYYSSFLI